MGEFALNHADFMQKALIEAKRAVREDEVPIGAVLIAEDGRVLAEAHNQTISLCDPTAHAEILALRAACRVVGNYRLLNTTLYVTVEPCIMCLGALVHARVARIVFGTEEPKWGGSVSCSKLIAETHLNHTIDIQGGVLENECKALMQNFFRSKRLKSNEE
jgi:tRNA(adenine34) deaminase